MCVIIHLSLAYLCICLFIYLSIYLYLFIYLFIYLFVCFIHLFTYLCSYLRGWGPDSGRWGRFMKAVKLFSDPTKTKIYKRLAL